MRPAHGELAGNSSRGVSNDRSQGGRRGPGASDEFPTRSGPFRSTAATWVLQAPRTSAEPAAPKSRRLSGRVRNAWETRRTHLGPVDHLGNDRWRPRATSFPRVLHGLAAPGGSAPKAKRPAARSDVAPLGDMHRVGERPRGARPAGSTPRRAPSRLSDGLRATGAATLRLELPAEPPLGSWHCRTASLARFSRHLI